MLVRLILVLPSIKVAMGKRIVRFPVAYEHEEMRKRIASSIPTRLTIWVRHSKVRKTGFCLRWGILRRACLSRRRAL